MASNKFDLSSESPDRPLYSFGNRGSHSMDRPGSFRETVDDSVSSSLPNLLRNNSSVGQSEVLNFLQCLPFGSKPVPLDLRSSIRQGDIRRNVAVAFGISPDNSPSNKGKLVAPPSQEEMKRVKVGLRESSFKARERIKFFDESISVINKFFPTVSTKKRSRSEVYSGDRSGPMLSNDRPMLGQGLCKVGSQNNINSSNFEHDMDKTEEQTKNSVPSKRRTSLADVKDMRGHGSMRSSRPIDRDRELPKLANGGYVQSDDRTLPIGDGWEKSKVKKKRSVIKPDTSSGGVSTKPLDGYREPRQGIQQRSINARPKLNSESHGFRPGTGNGVLGSAKTNILSQQSGLHSGASNSKVENERSLGPDKERVNLKAINKVNCRDEFNSSSPTSNSRMSNPIRAPRSSSGAAPKLAPMANRASVSNDWETGNCTNRPPTAVGDKNRKRTVSARSSSPPSSQVCTGKLQKTNRGRRTNPGPAASSNEEASPMDSCNESGLGFPRRMPISSPQLVKLKGKILSSSPVSEGDDSGATEMKTRDRVEEKPGHFQKLSTGSSRKYKSVPGEANGDGSRRHGRSGRGFVSSRSLLPMSGHEETAKQLRSARIGTDKNESKAGRPPTRRLSDRKAFPRQKHASVNSPADFSVISDDGHEELLAAANAVINPTHVAQPSFWSVKEPLFGFTSDVDIDFLKQQENVGSPFRMENHAHIDTDHQMGSAAFVAVETVGDGQSMVSLSERLLAALIPEEEADYCISETHDLIVDDSYGSRHDFDGNFESNSFSYKSIERSSTNGYMVTGMQDYHERGNGILKTISNSRPMNGLIVADQEPIPDGECSISLYNSMDINDKLLLEMHSVGIFPDLLPKTDRPQNGGINDEISELMEKYQMEAFKKKQSLDRLLSSTLKAKESQEKEFEQLALDKLVGMAYKKYMLCWGHGSGGKNSSTKMAKQAALAFIKRTLDRCTEFEDTGNSCFSKPLFKDIFESGSSRLSLARLLPDTNGEASKRPQPDTDQFGVPSDVPVNNNLSEQTTDKEETWLNRVKKRELLLDAVVGNAIGNSLASPSGMAAALVSSSPKGKRSERDREGKSGNTKGSGRSSVRGERKPKQKSTQLSVSINGLLAGDQCKQAFASGSKSKEKVELHKPLIDGDDDTEEVLDFSSLQLPGMDVLGGVDDHQGQDLASWLNMDDDNLQDQHDDFLGLEGLEIPMDDLSDLNMMV